MDSAGNWSASVVNSILLDCNKPVVIASPPGGMYSTLQTVALICDDGSGSGCDRVYYSIDGNDPTTVSAVYTEPISISRNTTLKFFARDMVGNQGLISTQTYTYNPPVTSASPAGVAGLGQPVSVSLTCNDSGLGCNGTYYRINSGAWTSYTVPLLFQDNTSLQFYSIDSLSNTEAIKTETYNFTQIATHLSILLSTQTIKQNDPVDVSGSLSEYSTANIDLSGLPVTLTVTLNSVPTATFTTTTDSVNGHYIFNDIGKGTSVFSLKGTYGITAHFGGTGLLQAANSSTQALLVGNSAGYAVIVEGKVPNDEGLQSHNKTANRIYQHLLDRGFAAANIFYYNYASQPGVDGTPSKYNVQNAIENLVKDKMNAVPAPLWVIMIDHGSPEKFYLGSEWISPTELNTWLTTLENSLDAPAKLEKRIIVIGACYSGSFIPALSSAPTITNAGRLVITSAAAGEESYKGPMEPDNIRSGEFFLEEFFKELVKGTSIKEAFARATDNTESFTSQGSGSANSVNSYGDSSVQHPLLNDTGKGPGSNTLSDGAGDGLVSEALYLGVGLTNSAANPADLIAVTPTLYLPDGTTSAVLTAVPDVYSYVDTAWIEVKAPTIQLVAQGGTGQLELNIPKKFMLPDDPNKQWNLTYGTSCTNNECFNTAGRYEVYYFTRNLYTEEISLLKKSVVYKDKAVSTIPAAVSLITPTNGSQQRTSLIFDWTDSSDPDGLTYSFILSTSATFTNEAYRKEDIPVSITALGPEAGLKDLTTYYWKVLAVDLYGALNTSPTWSFTTNNTNDTNGIVLGLIKSSATGTGIGSASVTVSGAGTVLTAPNGAYYIEAPSGAATLSVTMGGYTTPDSQGITVVSGETLRRDILLTPTSSTTSPLTVHTAGIGTGTVVSSPSGITCGGTCTSGFTTNQSITLTAASDPGSTFAGWSGACTGMGLCSISMTSPKDVTATFSPAGIGVPDGNLTGGTSPSIADALKALRIAAGLITPTQSDLDHGDVAPLVAGVPAPDGKIDINDAIVILRKSVGLVSW